MSVGLEDVTVRERAHGRDGGSWRRWGPPLAVAALIGYWSLVTTPPPATATLESLPETVLAGRSLASAFPAWSPLESAVPMAEASGTGVDMGGTDTPTRATLGTWLAALSVRHALAYAVFAVTLAHALEGTSHPAITRAVLVFGLATGYGAALECAQAVHPERVASLADVVANALGAASGLGLYAGRVLPIAVGQVVTRRRQ